MDSFKLIKIDSSRTLNKQIQLNLHNLNNTLKPNRINNNNPLNNNKIINHNHNKLNRFSNHNNNKLDYLYRIIKQLHNVLKLSNQLNSYQDHKLEHNHKHN